MRSESRAGTLVRSGPKFLERNHLADARGRRVADRQGPYNLPFAGPRRRETRKGPTARSLPLLRKCVSTRDASGGILRAVRRGPWFNEC